MLASSWDSQFIILLCKCIIIYIFMQEPENSPLSILEDHCKSQGCPVTVQSLGSLTVATPYMNKTTVFVTSILESFVP